MLNKTTIIAVFETLNSQTNYKESTPLFPSEVQTTNIGDGVILGDIVSAKSTQLQTINENIEFEFINSSQHENVPINQEGGSNSFIANLFSY
jgi:hypothetical protein